MSGAIVCFLCLVVGAALGAPLGWWANGELSVRQLRQRLDSAPQVQRNAFVSAWRGLYGRTP